MRTLSRNKRKFYYCLFDSTSTVTDGNGNETGTKTVYKAAVPMYANISSATGIAQTEQFGNLENYDKVIVTDDLNCPIDENSVLFIDKAPEYTKTPLGADDEPLYDYVVRRVARSINSISIAVRKVTVS